VKVSVIVQLAFGAYGPLQAFVMLKSVTLLPVRATEEMLRVALPEFVTETLMGELVEPCVIVGNITGFGVTVTAGAGGGGASPVPLSCTD
jgi:hypothetical protein